MRKIKLQLWESQNYDSKLKFCEKKSKRWSFEIKRPNLRKSKFWQKFVNMSEKNIWTKQLFHV